MPALFSLGLQKAFREARAQLQNDECLIAYLDDLYIVTKPCRARAAYEIVTTAVQNHCGIQPNLGKTVCWNRAGIRPTNIDDLGEHVWRGEGPADERGIKILGVPLGTNEFVEQFCRTRGIEERSFITRLQELPEIQ